jgi:hypothetical protein
MRALVVELSMTPPVSGSETEAGEAPAVAAVPETAEVGDEGDPLRRFRSMLRIGIPRQAVDNKMVEEGLDPSTLDLGDEETKRAATSTNTTMDVEEARRSVQSGESERLAKYQRMLKMGIPRQGVENKMTEEGLDPALLSSEITPAPAASSGEGVSVEREAPASDPKVAKYLRMLKMGVPRQGVENKMVEEGLDPALLDGGGGGGAVGVASLKETKAAVEAPPAQPVPTKKKKKKDQIKRKKLFWEEIKSELAAEEGSIWAPRDEDGPVDIDQKKFKALFTESPNDQEAKNKKKKEEQEPKEQKKKELNILDPRRSQNAAIALSRIRVKNAEIRRRVSILDESSFSATQLQALLDYLPTPDERMLIKAFSGDPDTLSPAEKFMKEMMPLQNASPLLSVMLFKRQHGEQVDSLRESISTTSSACDQVMGSRKLRIALKMILRIGNQMNESAVPAFALSSLSCLTGTKAFDKKTTVLRYLVQELSAYTGDTTTDGEGEDGEDGEDSASPVADLGDCLDFPESLPDLRDASATSYKGLEKDLGSLRMEIKRVGLVIAREVSIIEKDAEREPVCATMLNFIQSASSATEEIQGHLQESREIFLNLLTYLGIEDKKTTPEQVFQPLAEFLDMFVEERSKFRSGSSKSKGW